MNAAIRKDIEQYTKKYIETARPDQLRIIVTGTGHYVGKVTDLNDPVLFEQAVQGQMRSIVTNETRKAQSDCGAGILKRLVSKLGPMQTKMVRTFLESYDHDEDVDFASALRDYIFD